ncbi:MAG: DUF4372 domain-containing protein [Haliscomenobacter sp.]|nr:DUF4372 domain-containing protein [Haliscomenobacter sp.]
MALIHRQTFARIVEKYGSHDRIRAFSCWHQLLCMSFGQFTQRESLTMYSHLFECSSGETLPSGLDLWGKPFHLV